ncbi:DUF2752 domain-containing protein [Silvibacterium acidisoli]|uniref:DUF2752 domain-containing protein n=1 Tax=Acidobacteriaceae bacterium ZG23-2 TaxID=2883246 RepID=UPI00406C6943
MRYATRCAVANLLALATVVCAFLLRRFPPETTQFYPRCPVYVWLHLYCPGCGGTRAAAALLHGRFMEAIHWNIAFVMLSPLVLLFLALCYWRAVQRKDFVWPAVPESLLKTILVLSAVFFIARNIPAH